MTNTTPRDERPQIGSIVTAITATQRSEQRVRVEITAIDESNSSATEWVVWGYRQYPSRRRGVRRTMIPRIYIVPRSSESN